MRPIAKTAPVAPAIAVALVAASLRFDVGKAPESGGWQGTPGKSTFNGYGVVHPLPGGDTDGTIEAPDSDGITLIQLSTYGATQAQAETIADLAREVVVSGTLPIPGLNVVHISIDLLGGSTPIDEQRPRIWQSVDRYRITTEPEESP